MNGCCVIRCLLFQLLLHMAQPSVCAAQSLSPTYMQQYAHCSGIVYKTFATTITSLTPEQAAQMVNGPQHFLTAQVLGASFIEGLNQQRADHGSLDAATLATVAQVHAATQQELTAAGHEHGLATRADVQQILEETKKMREELEKVKHELAKKQAKEVVPKLLAPVPKKAGEVVAEVLRRPVTPPEGTVAGWFARRLKDLSP